MPYNNSNKINKKYGNSFNIPWNVLDIIKVFLVSFALFFCIILIAVFIRSNSIVQIKKYLIILYYCILYATTVFWIKKFYSGKIKDLGIFIPENWKKLVAIGIGTGCIIFFFTIAFKYYPTLSYNKINISNFVLSFLLLPLTIKGFSLILLGPFVEEVFYRGFLYPAMRKKLNIAIAIVLSSFIFTFLHLEFFKVHFIFAFTTRFIIGIVFTLIYEKYRNLLPCIISHATIGYLSGILALIAN